MPWLVVLGNSSWMYNGTRYQAGVHKVEANVAMAAMRAPVRFLHVTEHEPLLTRTPSTTEPLSLEDIQTGVPRGVQLAPEPGDDVEPEPPPVGKPARNYDFRCPHCTEFSAPSSGALTRHVEFHHKG